VDDFAGRMTAVGWLALGHAKGISQVTTNPATDKANLDLEVMVLNAFLRRKVQGNKRYAEEWPVLLKELDKLQGEAKALGSQQDQDPGAVQPDFEAARLAIRVDQLELLISSAVEEGVLDVAALPHDDRRKNGGARMGSA